MTDDQLEAYIIADWLRLADQDGCPRLAQHPPLNLAERTLAEVEG